MSPPMRLRVMTFNIHGGFPLAGPLDLEAVAGVIRKEQPDLVGLQEVHRRLPRSRFQDQPGRLRKLLRMEVVFLHSLGFGPIGYGNAVLSRVRPLQAKRIRLPGRGEPRALIEARFRIDDRDLRLLNTHLALDASTQQLQFEALRRVITADGGPLIALGDWNVLPDTPPVQTILDLGLSHCAGPDLHTYPCHEPNCRLDYIMVSRHFQVESCRTVPTHASDHLPLVSDIVLP